jgi:hypothetical protein
MSPRHSPAAAALICLAIMACDEAAVTPSPDAPRAPAHAFSNGPSSLPHVLRVDGRFIAGWVDFSRNTAIIIGAPLDPAQSRLCGGTVRSQFMPVQYIEQLGEVIKQLVLEPEANVLVYNSIAPSMEEALCEYTPYGRGQGLYLRSDNDWFGTGGSRANATSDHVHAEVDLTGGGTAVVNASIHGTWKYGAPVTFRSFVVINER